MQVTYGVGDRHRKNDPRDARNWTGNLSAKATAEGEQYILAAFARFLAGCASPQFKRAVAAEAKRCLADHLKREKKYGVSVHIE